MKRQYLTTRKLRIDLENEIKLAQLNLDVNTENYDDYMLRVNPTRLINETDEEYYKRKELPDKIMVEIYLQTIIKLKAELKLRELALEKHDIINKL